ncbi:MAG: hypothetical protein JWM77_2640 [Rhodospirillales bacterium]|nr:hypothetical protein [Rhodospirillales bacterium]
MTAHGVADSLADSGELLRFWFDEAGPSRWFDADPGFDALLRQRFGALHEKAASGVLDGWIHDSPGALALVLALDQLPRNIFRGTGRAFATDAKARRIAEASLARGFDMTQPSERRVFFYLPFSHSESVADQNRAVALFLGLRPNVGEHERYALQHREIIERFGRFPHRNTALGRVSTEDEQVFLQSFAGF